jgi:hypothetical protein
MIGLLRRIVSLAPSITNFSYSSNTLTITQSNGSNYSVTINEFTGLTITGPAYYQQNVTNTNPYEIANVGFVTAFTSNFESYVTGFTYNNANTISLGQNQGKPNFTIDIGTLASVTVNGDVTVTGVTTTGNLIVNNPSGVTATIGQGGLTIGSGGSPSNPGIGDLLVHGNFYVYGSGTTIATNELYIEDPTITLNYNPSGSSTSTSVGSGVIIQDGSGIVGTDTSLKIGQLYLDSNLNSFSEYTSATGNSNRGFFTQLNDIIVRNTNNNAGAPDGKRLLAEDDILDGGSY